MEVQNIIVGDEGVMSKKLWPFKLVLLGWWSRNTLLLLLKIYCPSK